MIVREYYKTRKDGVKLYISLDALVNENGEIVKDELGKPIPSGFYIVQNETGNMYAEAIDVENSPYTYSETTEVIETLEEEV